MNDQDELYHIIQYLKNGDRGSFSWLFKKHESYFRQSAMQYAGWSEDVDDLIGEAAVNMLTHVPVGKNPNTFDFKNYFTITIRNKYFDIYRKRRRAKKHLRHYSPETIVEDYKEPNLDELLMALENIPSKQKDVILMRLKGIKFHEIAEIMSISRNTATGTFRYARLSLHHLADKVFGPDSH